MSAPTLSKQSTLIVPVELGALGELGARERVALGDRILSRKKEHHVTVFGFTIGKPLGKALAASPALREALEAAIEAHDWSIRPGHELFHLERSKDGAELHTVIVGVACDLASFYAGARRLVGELAPDHEALLEALASPPTPHVTLYTSDPAGVAGIGLNAASDLADALARGASGEPGLRAHPLRAEDLREAP